MSWIWITYRLSTVLKALRDRQPARATRNFQYWTSTSLGKTLTERYLELPFRKFFVVECGITIEFQTIQFSHVPLP